jgi:hypothetical protein
MGFRSLPRVGAARLSVVFMIEETKMANEVCGWESHSLKTERGLSDNFIKTIIIKTFFYKGLERHLQIIMYSLSSKLCHFCFFYVHSFYHVVFIYNSCLENLKRFRIWELLRYSSFNLYHKS